MIFNVLIVSWLQLQVTSLNSLKSWQKKNSIKIVCTFHFDSYNSVQDMQGTNREREKKNKTVATVEFALPINVGKNPFADKTESIMSIQLLAMSGTIGSTVSTVTNYNLPFAIYIIHCNYSGTLTILSIHSLSLSLSLHLFLFLRFYYTLICGEKE